MTSKIMKITLTNVFPQIDYLSLIHSYIIQSKIMKCPNKYAVEDPNTYPSCEKIILVTYQ